MSTLSEKILDATDAILNPFYKAMESEGSPDEIIEAVNLGEKNENSKNVLLAYHTKHGSTSSLAKVASEQLVEQGFRVDLRSITNIEDHEDLSKYDVFILGCSIYWGQLTELFNKFVMKNERFLSQKPLALFTVSGTIQRDHNRNRQRLQSYVGKTFRKIPTVKPLRIGSFAGNIDFTKATWAETIVMGTIIKLSPLTDGDHREPAKVRSWIKEVVSLL